MDPELEQPTPAWMKTATVGVYLLVIVAFGYIFLSYKSQRDYFALMNDLVGGAGPEHRDAAVKTLKETDDSLPHVCSMLINGVVPENRLTCADIILARLEARRPDVAKLDEEDRLAAMRRGVDMHAVSSALLDESSDVRRKALKIIELTGTEKTYQKTSKDEMHRFEAMLEKLRSDSEQEQTDAVEEFRQAGERALNFLVGTVFSDDPDFSGRGMKTLQVVLNDILRGSNQKRIVLVVGRRRCQLLIREMTGMTPENRKVMMGILNVSGRVPEKFFTDMMKDLESESGDLPLAKIRPYVLELEELERVRAAGVPTKKIGKMTGKTE